MVVFALCGLWHGASWNFVIWGLFHGVFLTLERLAARKQISMPFRSLRHVYVILVVLVSWVFFRAETAALALSFIGAMVGMTHHGQVMPGLRVFVDTEVVTVVILGIIGSTPVLPAIKRRWERSDWLGQWREAAGLLGLMGVFVYCVMLMAAGSYSPFIYFRF
jgi:alginate O-acetyltransferase complex protein AlgI